MTGMQAYDPAFEKPAHPLRVCGAPIEKGEFLAITGLIDEAGKLSIEPGFHLDYRRARRSFDLTDEALKQAVVIEFLDDRKNVLTQAAIPASPVCGFGGAALELKIFAASIRYPAGYHFVRYYVEGRLQRELSKPSEPPKLKFSRAPIAKAADYEAVGWEIEAPDGTDIRSIVLYSHDNGHSWEAVVPPSSSRSNQVPVCFALLPGGTGLLRALVTDGFATCSVLSDPFEVPRKGVRPTILGPADGATVSASADTWLHGQAYDHEKRDEANDELLWCSSRDGELGRGSVVNTRLSPGVHEITLKCAGAQTSVSLVAEPDRPPREPDCGCGSR